MRHPFRALCGIVWLAILVAIPALPSTAIAQDARTATGLSPRLLAEASWHGRPIQRPLPSRSDAADRDSGLQPGTGLRTAGGSSRVRDLQRRLIRLGYRPGPSDGLYGPRTQAAVIAFQRKHGLERTGEAGTRTLSVLRRRTSRPPGTAGPAQATEPAPRTPAAPAAPPTRPQPVADTTDAGGLPLLAVILLIAAALMIVATGGALVRSRTHRAPVLAPPARHRAPDLATELDREPERDPEPQPEPEREPEPEPEPQPQSHELYHPPRLDPVVPEEHLEPPRITRHPRPRVGTPLERRIALRERILAMRAEGMTLQQIADQLTEEGEPTLGGSRSWQPWSVRAATRPINPRTREAPHGRRDTS
jgi:hypothetical protein